MNERANELIKSISELKYDASTGLFETDRRTLYDLIELTVKDCIDVVDVGGEFCSRHKMVERLKEHFGVKE